MFTPPARDGLLDQLARHGRIWRAALTQALKRDAQFRAQAWTTGLVALAEIATGLIPVLLIIRTSSQINGWTGGQIIAVTGMFQLAMGVLNTFVAPNLTRIDGYVREGELDTILIRPASAQWLTTFRWIQPAAFTGALAGVALIIVGLWGSPISPVGVIAAVLVFGCGLAMIGCLWANLSYLAFWFEAASFIHTLVREALTAGRYPVAFFPSAIRAVLIFVVPIGAAASLPVQFLSHGVDLALLGGVILAAVVIILLTRLHWRLALARYSSASS
ncbi:ABC transporter permease [Microlunatus speluncae]|uniref:ABC transporter permease n=1 Tax=Microlunatus speluncae TaxID=2594267 RepID=UPI0012668685|nr:ABC-2 family transporter protein [Microlunatus speluncae]